MKLIAGGAVLLMAGLLVWLPKENFADGPEVTVYKSATCGCCGKWIEHMQDAGFKVTAHNRQDMNQIKEEHGVAYELRSCHTAVVDGYVLEGHVPAGDIRRLLKERPAVDGLAVPGMPSGSPGMEGNMKIHTKLLLLPRERRTLFLRSIKNELRLYCIIPSNDSKNWLSGIIWI